MLTDAVETVEVNVLQHERTRGYKSNDFVDAVKAANEQVVGPSARMGAPRPPPTNNAFVNYRPVNTIGNY